MALTAAQLRQLRRSDASGNRLKLARALAEQRQADVAKAIGLSQSALSDLERQRYSATTVEVAHRLAAYFGCAIEDLFPARHAGVA